MNILEDLAIDLNTNLVGTVDDVFDCGNCSQSLQFFSSEKVDLTGSFPDRIGDFTRLTFLRIRASLISGTIPSSLGLLTRLSVLDLSVNYNFADPNPLPTELGMLTQMKEFSVSNSIVTDQLPTEFGNMRVLEKLHIDLTWMEGAIPLTMCQIPSLKEIKHPVDVDCGCSGSVCEL
ncbi:MAG: hypothetical protein SGARI_004208, partial [Bacillariaceae sp.]